MLLTWTLYQILTGSLYVKATGRKMIGASTITQLFHTLNNCFQTGTGEPMYSSGTSEFVVILLYNEYIEIPPITSYHGCKSVVWSLFCNNYALRVPFIIVCDNKNVIDVQESQLLFVLFIINRTFNCFSRRQMIIMYFFPSGIKFYKIFSQQFNGEEQDMGH